YAQTVLDDLASDPAELPDGILPAVYLGDASGWPINDTDVRPDDMESQAPGTGVAGLRSFRNSLVQFRKIHQETTRVPRATGSISRYVLRFAPLEYYKDPSGTNGYYDLLTIYSLKTYTRVDKDDLDRYNNRDGYYCLDPDDEDATGTHTLWFSGVKYDRTFKVDYGVRDSGSSNNTDTERFTDKLLFVPASADGSPSQALDYTTRQPFTFESSSQAFIWGSESVHRRFRDTTAEPDPVDPYSYRLVNNTLGVVQFNGSAAGTPIGIDYSVMDWQILHDDIDVPTEPDPDRASLATADQRAWMKLSFPFIDRDSTLGAQNDTRAGMQQPVIIQNIDPNSPGYGDIIDSDNSNGTWTFDDPVRQSDESRTGRIGLLVAPFNQAGQTIRRIRVYYRTLDGYFVQVQKPFATYKEAEWWVVPQRPSYNSFVHNNTKLYFALCDVGKAVSVDYTYLDPNGAQRKVVGEMHTIEESNERTGAPEGLITLNVPENGGTPLQMRSIDSVRGMSLEVRVSWAIRGTPNRMYDILSAGWGGSLIPNFWSEQKGRLQTVTVSAVVAKPRDL
ncbi:MAG TPA: hypothetical protein VHR86_08175, partial [Armatimonadota bacterium]|nr:hypothetical protein [Armatimonadota bacterium]